MIDLNKEENLILSTSRDGTSKLWQFNPYDFESNRLNSSI